MANFAVKYQLNEAKDYPKLWEEMERLGGHKVLRSFYFLDVQATAKELRDHLMGYVDQDDAIVVVPMLEKPFTKKAFQGTQAWIDARF